MERMMSVSDTEEFIGNFLVQKSLEKINRGLELKALSYTLNGTLSLIGQKGHAQIKDYWTRQWKEINPTVEPVEFAQKDYGTMEIKVLQDVKDLEGKAIFHGFVKHVYTVEDGLLRRMDIEL